MPGAGLLVTCRMCGVEFEPTSSEIMAGVWRTCEPCRVDGSPGPRPGRELEAGAVGVSAHAKGAQ